MIDREGHSGQTMADLHLRLADGSERKISVPDGETLARAVWLYGGLPAPFLCGGLGRCGLCRMQLEGLSPLPPASAVEREVLGDKAVAEGWRLGCRHDAGEAVGLVLNIPKTDLRKSMGKQSGNVGEMVKVPAHGSRLYAGLSLAVDLGTTSICWQALDPAGNVVASGQLLNPQSGAGGDIVSRLAVAAQPEGRARLSRMIVDILHDILHDLSPESVVEICMAGNTAMTAIALDLPVDGLLAAPYSRPLEGGAWVILSDLPPVWIPPQPAPFVGGDIAAGMAWALQAMPSKFPFLFADLGTNGECVLALDAGHCWVTSVPLGPALEGIGLSCGGLAGPGSVTGFGIGPGGLKPTVWGGGSPKFLCGTGVLSLLDVLRRAGVLQADGTPQPASPLARRLLDVGTGARLPGSSASSGQGTWRIRLPGGLYLDARDVEAVLNVRAAFVVAEDRLLAAAGLAATDLAGILLAGALGEHAPLDALERLGFWAPGLTARTLAVGNASLAGAALLLIKPQLREPSKRWSQSCRLVDVTADPSFMHLFTAAMRLD